MQQRHIIANVIALECLLFSTPELYLPVSDMIQAPHDAKCGDGGGNSGWMACASKQINYLMKLGS